jgi:hypothetical protein
MRLPMFLLFILVLVVALPVPGQSFQVVESPPPLIRMTGIFLTAEAAKKHSSVIELRVQEQLLTFHVREVRSPTDPTQGRSVLRNLGGFLRVKGPAETLNLLLGQATYSEPLVLEGRLYQAERVLMLSSVELLK